MKYVGIFLGSLAFVALAAGAVACNGLLGIGSATVGEGSDAGPVEAGVSCSYYCQTITQNCSSASAQEFQGSIDLCNSMCNTLLLDEGSITDTSGNTLGCRINFAQQAATADNAVNCRNAGFLGGGVCGVQSDACNNFCQLDVPYCQSKAVSAPSYVSPADCNSHCLGDGGVGGFVFTTDGGSTGVDLPEGTNTLNCRFYHLENAWPSPARGKVHCPHTMPVSATCN